VHFIGEGVFSSWYFLDPKRLKTNSSQELGAGGKGILALAVLLSSNVTLGICFYLCTSVSLSADWRRGSKLCDLNDF
jgi:hypothetical protein